MSDARLPTRARNRLPACESGALVARRGDAAHRSAEDLLAERRARGEIDEYEYRRRRDQ